MVDKILNIHKITNKYNIIHIHKGAWAPSQRARRQRIAISASVHRYSFGR